jgi:glycosyltransferase involved in cell wall biosynthesis
MTNEFFVSVIIPAYEVATFIKNAVESVLSQTWSELEVVVVDDGSTDGTLQILRSMADPRLTILSQTNKGSAAARNAGLQVARGNFVAFLDGDDVWSCTKLEEQVETFRRNPDIDLVFTLSRIIDERGRDTGRRSVPVAGHVSLRQLMVENIINNGSAVMLRRSALEAVGLFDVDLPSCVDYDLWLRIGVLRPNNIYCISRPLTHYRIRDGQITKNWRRMEAGWSRVIEKLELSAPNELKRLRREIKGRMYRYLSYIAYESGEFSESRSLYIKAIRSYGMKLLKDRRVLLLLAALTSQLLLPVVIHEIVDTSIRRLRSR